MSYQLFAHQEAVAKRSETEHAIHLTHKCGTGKTLAALEIIRRNGGTALVVCPLLLIENAWVPHLDEFMPDMKYVNLWDKKPANRAMKLAQKATVYLINFEQFKSMWFELSEKKFDIIIVDESSKMKNPKSQITKALLAFGGVKSKDYRRPIEVPKRFCMSGTPAPNHQGEYWPQITFLDRTIFGPNYYKFRNRYFRAINCGMFTKYEFIPEMEAEFAEKIRPILDIVDTPFDLPPVTNTLIYCDLSKEEQNAYNEIRDALVLELEAVTVLAPYTITKLQKLRQLACGFIYHEDEAGNRVVLRSVQGARRPAKIDALAELLEMIGDEQVIIWSIFQQATQDLADFLGDKAAIASGKKPEVAAAISNFLNRRKQYIVQNPMSAAHGLNYQHNSRYSVFYTPDWSYELLEQAKKRTERYGQKLPMTNYFICSRNTIDDLKIIPTTDNKAEIEARLLRRLRGQL